MLEHTSNFNFFSQKSTLVAISPISKRPPLSASISHRICAVENVFVVDQLQFAYVTEHQEAKNAYPSNVYARRVEKLALRCRIAEICRKTGMAAIKSDLWRVHAASSVYGIDEWGRNGSPGLTEAVVFLKSLIALPKIQSELRLSVVLS